MSKFKKKASKLFKLELDKTLEEQLDDYLKDADPTVDPWNNDVNDMSNISNTSLFSNGDEFYDSIMKLYISDLEHITRDAKPRRYQAISGSGPAWYFEPHTRTFVKTERGMQVLILADDEDDLGRLLVQTMNTLIMVPKEEILDLGYN
tara:strand:+ start:256 stop:699 length:444 start_codon:yes stop_codon:yes gene_type:complete